MLEKMCVKSTVISVRPNWLDKRGNSIQSLSLTYQLRGATEAGLFGLFRFSLCPWHISYGEQQRLDYSVYVTIHEVGYPGIDHGT